METRLAPQARSGATRNDGVLGSIPSVGSTKAQQTAAVVLRTPAILYSLCTRCLSGGGRSRHRGDRGGLSTFLNVGVDYPDPSRFVVLIWRDDRSAFPRPPESTYDGTQSRVLREVTEYDGHAQIVVASPEAIQVTE